MFVSTLETAGATLLRVDFNGDAQPVWHQPQATSTWGIRRPMVVILPSWVQVKTQMSG
jgi:hypothetical protein